MKSIRLLCLIGLTAAGALAQPTIKADNTTCNGVCNAHSLLPDIAPGSWFIVKGTGLGPATIAIYSGSLPYPTTFSQTSVSLTPAAGGTAVTALIYYTLATQVAALLPSSTPVGDYDVKVTYSNQASNAWRVHVVARNFGIATQSSNGAGPAQATYGGYDLNRFTTGQIPPWSTRPAKSGDTVVLWGNGLGADAASDQTGGTSGDRTAAAQVQVLVGGIAVTPVYAGRSSGTPGLDQINFTVPSNVTPSCFVSLQVTAGGRKSNLVSIAVVAAGQSSCSSPSFTTAQLAKLDQGGTLVIGSLGLSKTLTRISVPGLGTMDSSTETASGSFGKYTIDAVATSDFSLVQIGACFIIHRTGTQDQILQGTLPTPLDAGAQLTLNGPNASNKALTQQPAGSFDYSLTLYSSGVGGFGGSGSPTLTQGTYTISGTGGADIGAFSATVDFPGSFTWTNQDSISDPIPRSSGLNITWTGGGSGLVTIAGTALAQSGGDPNNPIYDAAIFYCTAQASAGSFTVPSSVLQQMPVVSSDVSTGTFGTLSVLAIPDASKGQGVFSAPLTAGGTTDQAFFTYTVGSTKLIGYN